MLKSKEKKLISLVLVMVVFGIIMVYSSSWPYAKSLGYEAEHFTIKQGGAALLGLVLMVLVSFLPYKIYKKLSVPIYILTYILCLLLFTPLGDSYGTFARRWLNLFGLSFMPSDFLKIGAIILMADFLSSRKDKLGIIQDIGPVLVLIGLTVLPIYLQPNLSTVVLLIGVLFSMYIISGMNLNYFKGLVPIGVITVLAFFSGEKNAYRRERLSAMLNPLEDYYDTGWQLSQALFAISSGGIFGLGFGRSNQKHLYLSEAHNDFIFAIIAEELGLIGCGLVILAFLYFLRLGFQIAAGAKDRFGQLLATGITLMVALQALINMSVSLGLVPPTGLVLPFISYGGTSLLINLIMVGILLNISRTNRRKNQ